MRSREETSEGATFKRYQNSVARRRRRERNRRAEKEKEKEVEKIRKGREEADMVGSG